MKEKYNKKAADRVVKFFGLLKHTKGKWAGTPFILADWQENEIIRPLFGTLNSDGNRQYRTAYIEIPKKNGKSSIAAGIALYLLFADREKGSEIYSVAVDRDQAGIVFNIATQMVRQSPELLKRCKIIDSQKRIVIYKTASFYHAVSADIPTKEGVNPHGVIFDELHAQPNRQLWDIFTTSGGTRTQPLIFVITTAGYDRKSICWEQHSYAEKVQKGIIRDPTFFPYVKAAPQKANWMSEKVWEKCNPALGDFRSLEEMRMFAKKAKEVPASQNTFRRYYLNQWTQQKSRWLSVEKWDAAAGSVNEKELEGRDCYAALDLASSVDIAALALVFPVEDILKALLYFWLPEENMLERSRRDKVPYDVWVREGLIEATPGNVIDYKAIKKKITEELNLKFHIKEIAFDRWGMTQLSQDLNDAGFTMVPFGQGFASMSAPTKELLTRVLAKKIEHGGNPVLRWMADNMVVKQDPAGNIKPDKGASSEKIDGIVALIMALDRATRHQNEGSVYEERGIISV